MNKKSMIQKLWNNYQKFKFYDLNSKSHFWEKNFQKKFQKISKIKKNKKNNKKNEKKNEKIEEN